MNGWIIYTRGNHDYLMKIEEILEKHNPNFEWKIIGNTLLFKPKETRMHKDELGRMC